MNFLKKLSITLIAVIMLFSAAYAKDGKVEISFSVGDSEILINGEKKQVQTPYVVGDGVTLVPLRVITEAFGAEVNWEDATQTVTLNYPEISIVLQIGNSVAEVNKKAEKLLSAPELKNDTPMVPLRFISETFGATVTYDNDTELITVVKEEGENGQTTVVGEISENNIGDSYYNWSMENPKKMNMEIRSFDGLDTVFSYGENDEISIAIGMIPEEYDFDRDFTETKSSLKDFALVKADKITSVPGRKSMHFQAKDSETFLDIYYHIANNYVYSIVGTFSEKTPELRDEFLKITGSFAPAYFEKDLYDLSNVKSNMRKYTDEKLNVSFDVPENFYMVTDNNSPYYFRFANTDIKDSLSYVAFGVYSKSEVTSAAELAKKDRTGNIKFANKSLVDASAVSNCKYTNFDGVEYSYTVKGTNNNTLDSFMKDVFFEKGDYVYNLSVGFKGKREDNEEKTKRIIDSVDAKEIDSSKVGMIMRNDIDEDEIYTSKTSKWSMELPYRFIELSKNDGGAVYASTNGVSLVYVYSVEKESNMTEALKRMKDISEMTQLKDEISIISKPGEMSTPDGKYAYFSYKSEDEDGYLYYYVQYIKPAKNAFNIFSAIIPESVYSFETTSEIGKIFLSVKN